VLPTDIHIETVNVSEDQSSPSLIYVPILTLIGKLYHSKSLESEEYV
jgi:hypothetical protein